MKIRKTSKIDCSKICAFVSVMLVSYLLHADAASYGEFYIVDKMEGNASSILIESGKNVTQYSPNKSFDYKKETAWCEGKEDDGVGEWLEIKWKPTIVEKGFIVGHGVLLSRHYYNLNNRIRDYEATVYFSSGRTEIITGTFRDTSCNDGCYASMPEAECAEFKEKNKNLCEFHGQDGGFDGGELLALKEKGFQCITGIKIKIVSVYPGKKFKDTCISEIRIYQPRNGDEEFRQKQIEKAQKTCK